MTAFVGLLRAVNVGGRKLAMDDLRAVVRDLGHAGVRTYLQSGNVLFTSEDDDEGRVAGGIERALSGRTGLDVRVLLRTRAELGAVLAGNPYLDRESDPTKLPVTFLAGPPAPERLPVPVPPGETGVLTVAGREVYLHVPDGYGRSKLSNAYLERKLGTAATTRNWRSVAALHDLLPG